MSDNEDYFSGDNSSDDESSVLSDNEELDTRKKKFSVEEDVEDEDEDVDVEEEPLDEEDEDEDEDDDDYDYETSMVQKGGADSNPSNKRKTKIVVEDEDDEDEDNNEDDDEDYEEDENYLQKFDKEINKNYIEQTHPECVIHNFQEILGLTKVTRDKNNNIIDPFHKTIPFLTKYEKTRIIGQRAKQINSGAKPFINVPENIIDGYIIAEMELQQKKIPFIIRRPLNNGGSEYWKLSDLENVLF